MLAAPKSGKDAEEAYVPELLAARLAHYIQANGVKMEDRIFPVSTSGGGRIAVLAGQRMEIRLRPHDLRRHSATCASRSRG